MKNLQQFDLLTFGTIFLHAGCPHLKIQPLWLAAMEIEQDLEVVVAVKITDGSPVMCGELPPETLVQTNQMAGLDLL